MNLIRILEVLLEISRKIFGVFCFNLKNKTSQIETVDLEEERVFFLFKYAKLIELS